MKSKLSVSIVIPTYNSSKTILRAINSVIKTLEGLDGYEIIIIDDGSDDDTNDVIKNKFRDNSLIKYYYQDNKGVSSARNAGVTLSNKDYIAFLDSDDFYFSDFRDFLINIQYDKYDFFTAAYSINGKVVYKKNHENDFVNFLESQYFCTNSIVIKKDLLIREKFREGEKFGEDVDVWLRLLKKYRGYHFNRYVVSAYEFIPKLHDSREHPFVKKSMQCLELSDYEKQASLYRFEKRSNLITSFKRECSFKDLLHYNSLSCYVAYIVGEKGYDILWKLKNTLRR